MKRISDCTDEELVSVAQKTKEKYMKAYSEAKSIADEYGFQMEDTESNILNTVFAKLKERRDTVSKEDVERIMRLAIEQLNRQGQYNKLSELLSLMNNEKYSELAQQLKQMGFLNEQRRSHTNSSSKPIRNYDLSHYSVNGDGDYPKTHVAQVVVELYAKKYPEKSPKQIVQTYRDVLPRKYQRFFMTKEEFESKLRASEDSNYARRYDEVVLPSGERIYSSNQYDVERITELMDYVNRQNWGITIEKI